MTKIAVVAGGTGLVGGHLIRQLCQHKNYESVIALVRSQPNTDWASHPKVTIKKIDFDHMDTQLADIRCDEVYCALGTTAKKSPHAANYKKIDQDYPIALAKMGLARGARYFGLVSAMGARQSSLSKYLHYKAVVENYLLASEYLHVAIARPSLLLGERSEFRLAESMFALAAPCIPITLKPVHGCDVAGALIHAANNGTIGVEFLVNKNLHGRALTY